MKFGTDGIRGRANVDVTPELAMHVGNALVTTLGERVAVARDTRPSGPMLVAAVTAGVCAAGGEVWDLGVVPTPGLSALVARLGLNGGVMVTASHNPAQDNGLKAVGPDGAKLAEDARKAIEGRLGGIHHAERPGSVRTVGDAGDRYVEAVLDALPRGRWLAGRAIAVDTANGAATGHAARVLDALGARVVAVGDGPGERINAGCGALHPDHVANVVRSSGADAGIALDGDGDRGQLVLDDGTPLDGDALLWLCATGEVVVGTVMSNGGLEAGLAARGVRLVRTPVGDAHVADGMRAHGAKLGGEPSGHVLFADALPTADGLVATLRALWPDPRGVRERLQGFVPFEQVNLSVRVPGDRVRATDTAAAELREAGARVVVRASGTEAVVRVMVEHADPAVARAGAERLRGLLIAG